MSVSNPTAETSAEASAWGPRGRAPEWWPWIRSPVLFFAGVIAALISITSVWFLNIYLTIDEGGEHLEEAATKDLDDAWDALDGPQNFLILGSDSRAGLSEEQQARHGSPETVGGERSDTIILLSVDPRREQAIVVHFPRDLRVTIPGQGTNKINAAYEFGGPNLVIRTVKEFTGMPVHHYVEIDLAGFEQLVEAVGGVRICVDRPMYDELAGLAIPKAGCYVFDGPEALAYVRARHVEGDVIPDFSRIRRQQQFMRAMMNRLLSVESLLSQDVITQAVGAIRTDANLETSELIQLGRQLQGLAEEDPTGAKSLDLRVVPGDTQTIGEVSYVVPDEGEAARLFEAIRKGDPLGQLGLDLALTLPSPAVVKVRVLTGPGALSDDVEQAESVLRRAGFIVLRDVDAPAGVDGSEIIHKSGDEDRAELVSGFFPELELEMREVPSDVLGEAEVALVVGDDYTSGRE